MRHGRSGSGSRSTSPRSSRQPKARRASAGCGIEQYSASRILFTRFDFTTGDAAGQNLTGKATAAACAWITSNHEGITNFYLESNFATDKKSSQINILRTRGKRVVAEVTIPAALIEEQMGTTSEKLFRARQVSQLGGFMSGVNNNGLQSANGIAALFIATGQDAANVAESSAALGFSELLPNGDYYGSITLPSLIVGTYGGGTGLATQRECLEDSSAATGPARFASWPRSSRRRCSAARSLGWAIVLAEWVRAHSLLGRNRPTSRILCAWQLSAQERPTPESRPPAGLHRLNRAPVTSAHECH